MLHIHPSHYLSVSLRLFRVFHLTRHSKKSQIKLTGQMSIMHKKLPQHKRRSLPKRIPESAVNINTHCVDINSAHFIDNCNDNLAQNVCKSHINDLSVKSADKTALGRMSVRNSQHATSAACQSINQSQSSARHQHRLSINHNNQHATSTACQHKR